MLMTGTVLVGSAPQLLADGNILPKTAAAILLVVASWIWTSVGILGGVMVSRAPKKA